MEKKHVIIDGHEYEVTLFSDRKGQTGCCYRLQVPEKNLDLAVKLYHQDFCCDYLDLEDILRMREFFMDSFPTVSYTHLDVYKRQVIVHAEFQD